MDEQFIDRVMGVLLEMRLDELSPGLMDRAARKAEELSKEHDKAAGRHRKGSEARIEAYRAGAQRRNTARKIRAGIENRQTGHKRQDIEEPGHKEHGTVGFGTNRRSQKSFRRAITKKLRKALKGKKAQEREAKFNAKNKGKFGPPAPKKGNKQNTKR